MNNLVIQEPEYVSVRKKGSYGNVETQSVSMYPYNSTLWKEAVSKFGISLPQNLVSLADGKTTCKKCGSVYSGRQFLCENVVSWIEVKIGWGGEKIRSLLCEGDFYRDYSGGYKVEKSYLASCNSDDMAWDRSEEFFFQQEFFNLLNSLADLESKDNSPLSKYAEFIPHSKYDLIDLNLMRNRLNQLEFRQGAIVGAIREIAERMRSAGNSLNIGNF